MPDIIPYLLRLLARGVEVPRHLTLEEQRAIVAGNYSTKTRKRGNRKGSFPDGPFPWSPPGRTLHLVLPDYLPPSLNEYSRKKSVRMKSVPEAVQQIKWALLECKGDSRKFWRAQLHIQLYFPVRRRRDSRTNFSKIMEDAAVDAGLLVDDSEPWCETTVATDVDADNPRTEVTLTERGPAERG